MMVVAWTGQNVFCARKQSQNRSNAQETPEDRIYSVEQATTPWLVTLFNLVKFEACQYPLMLRS